MLVKRLKFISSFIGLLMGLLTNTAYAEQQGISVDMLYIGEGVQNVSGGLKQDSTYLGTGDLAMVIDTEQAGWWQGGTWFIEALVNHGTDPSSFIGDAQTASNIADGNRTRLQQFWYEHTLNEQTTILLGLHDLNSEFYVSEYGSLFLNSSFGVGPDISANVPTSLWPEAGFAVRLDWHGKNNYLHLAVYDGDPSTRKVDQAAEGVMWIGELGYLRAASAYKLGVWKHTAQKIAPDGKVFGTNSGIYAVVDQAISDDTGIFVQLGLTPSDRNEINRYLGLGLHLHGLIPSRYDDTFGIAIARAGFSPINQSINGITTAETTLEITYDMPVTENLNIHPALQWIQHPSGDPSLQTANVAMLRFELHLP